jgi:hypothetical protein
LASASDFLQAADLDRAERDVLEDRLVGEEVERLEHHADVGAQLSERLALGGQRLAVDQDPAVVDRLEPVDGAAEGRLAGAGRPDDDDDLLRGDLEVDVLQHVQVTEPLVDTLDGDERLGHVALRCGSIARR